ncbi:HlyD family secretion protein [Belliella sp. DSM 111904]|uniref:HlyD family secretion protein n=1 Tax=Belliella filtrata TaxID=2923435 RepID=A0ABS9V2L2_9BACT|nr:HlyD family efflux transporter periplasmic adaptor subunit [Belliella filtrata]MCH7410654.1 HlyD family secretion protein [Belliella filtrata]
MPNYNQIDNIELRSEEVQEIISSPPSWIIRWGITLMFFLVGMLIMLSFFIKYPDYITAKVMVTTLQPTEKVIARGTGQIDKMFVNNGESVEVGQRLASIKTTGDFNSVLTLLNHLESIPFGVSNGYDFPIETTSGLELGEIEVAYTSFERSYLEYKLIEKLKPFLNQLEGQEYAILEARDRLEQQKSQKKLLEKKFDLVKKDFDRNKGLFQDGAISARDFEIKEIEYIQIQEQLNQMSITISQLQGIIANAENSINSTVILKEQEESRSLNNLVQSYYGLKRSVREWEQQYVLRAWTNGLVSFQNVWAENQIVTSGDHIFTIFPENKTDLIGKLTVPSLNSGKVELGQKVLIKLDNFPYQQFGTLNGTINNISISPDSEGNYLIYIDIPDGTRTSYQQEIPLNQELLGTAEIITEDLSIAERLFFKFRSVQRFE